MNKVFLVVNKMNISYLKDNYSVSSYSFSKHLKYDRLERFKTYLKSVKVCLCCSNFFTSFFPLLFFNND